MSFNPLSYSRLLSIERDFDRILKIPMDVMLRATIQEQRLHFINRSIQGIWNWDIDNIIANSHQKAIISMKIDNSLRPHNYDWPYTELTNGDGWELLQQIANDDCTKFSLYSGTSKHQVAHNITRRDMIKLIMQRMKVISNE